MSVKKLEKVLERIRNVEGQVRVARKARYHNKWDPSAGRAL
jgi:hypothetical protein